MAGHTVKQALSLMAVQHVWVSTVRVGSAERDTETETDRGASEDHEPELRLLPLVRPPSHCRRGHPSVRRDTQPEPLPPQDHHRVERNLSYSSPHLWHLSESKKKKLAPRPKLSDCQVSARRDAAALTSHPAFPTVARSQRSAERPKDEIKRKFGGFHSASVFCRRSQSRLILRGS